MRMISQAARSSRLSAVLFGAAWMRTRDEHLKQASDNEGLGERLLLSGDVVPTTWAATLSFNSALHSIEISASSFGMKHFSRAALAQRFQRGRTQRHLP